MHREKKGTESCKSERSIHVYRKAHQNTADVFHRDDESQKGLDGVMKQVMKEQSY